MRHLHAISLYENPQKSSAGITCRTWPDTNSCTARLAEKSISTPDWPASSGPLD